MNDARAWFTLPQPKIDDLPRSIDVLGVPVNLAHDLDAVVDIVSQCLTRERRLLVTFVDPKSVAFAAQDPTFRTLLTRFDLVLPKAKALADAINGLRGLAVARVSFDAASLATPVFQLAAAGGYSVCLVGGKPGVAGRVQTDLEAAFPALTVIAALDGYGEVTTVAASVRNLDPDIIVTAMGARADEAFLLEMARLGWRGAGFTCGADFGPLAATAQDKTRFGVRPKRGPIRHSGPPGRAALRHLASARRAARRLVDALWPQRLNGPQPANQPPVDPQRAAAAARDPARLRALRAADLLDTAPEQAFDQLARLAARITGAPMALVSLVDADRQFFKASFGELEGAPFGRETPLSHSFCQYAVASKEPLVIEDARDHQVLRQSPAVTAHGLVAYAGLPLITREGHAVGTVCVLDDRPRAWRREDIAALQAVIVAVGAQIEERTAARGGERPAAGTELSDEMLSGYVASLDAYDQALGRDPGSLGFLAEEAALQAGIIRRRVELQRYLDETPDVASPLIAALTQHLNSERQRQDAAHNFAAAGVGLGAVEQGAAAARADAEAFRSEWRKTLMR